MNPNSKTLPPGPADEEAEAYSRRLVETDSVRSADFWAAIERRAKVVARGTKLARDARKKRSRAT